MPGTAGSVIPATTVAAAPAPGHRTRPGAAEQARRKAWGKRWGPLLSHAAAAARATREHTTT